MKRIGLLILWGLWLYGNIQAQSVMHVVILGDSNTFIGGDQCDKPQGWNKWFKELAKPLSCRSYARSGATWTHTPNTVYDIEENTGVLSDNNVIYNQVNRLLKETGEEKTQPTPDLILIMAGTNDLWFASKRPEPLAKYIRQNCETLGTAFPKARIILITPPPFTRVPMATQHQAAAEIEQCAQADAPVCHPSGPGEAPPSRKETHQKGLFQGRRAYHRERGKSIRSLYLRTSAETAATIR